MGSFALDRAALSILDDTDCATVENIQPVYHLLGALGFRTTKTVWPLRGGSAGNREDEGQTLQDSSYLKFIQFLVDKGFEIGLHGVRGGSSKRGEVLEGLEEYHHKVGNYPRLHVNHSWNRDNLYWGEHRLSLPPLKRLYRAVRRIDPSYFAGHQEGTDYFWGDAAKERITYVRNFTFAEINTLRLNPSMPYHDPGKPFVNGWFSSADGRDVDRFSRLLRQDNLLRLEAERGVCIVYTHFASGFVSQRGVDPRVREALEFLARRDIQVMTVSEILDELQRRRGGLKRLPPAERLALEVRWACGQLPRR